MLAQYVAHGMAQNNVYEWVHGLKCGRTTCDDEEDQRKFKLLSPSPPYSGPSSTGLS